MHHSAARSMGYSNASVTYRGSALLVNCCEDRRSGRWTGFQSGSSSGELVVTTGDAVIRRTEYNDADAFNPGPVA